MGRDHHELNPQGTAGCPEGLRRWHIEVRAEPGLVDRCARLWSTTGRSKPNASLWLFFHFFIFSLRAGCSLISLTQALGGEGEAWRWLESKRDERIHWRLEEGHRAKKDFYGFLFWWERIEPFILPKGRKWYWQRLLTPLPTPLQNLPLTPKGNEINTFQSHIHFTLKACGLSA